MTAPRSTALPEVLRAPDKLTWRLRIVGVRDDGMHPIDAEMTSLGLADSLLVSEGHGLVVNGASGLPVETDDDNLVSRALRVAGRSAQVVLTKNIPAGAGLGGGSSDAAAILRWAGVADLEVAARLGADVAFCLVGGRARVQGIGEVVEPLPFEDRVVTLLTPPFGCSTPAVYGMWDEMGGPTSDGPNDLEAAALQVEPRLAEWRDRLGDATGCTPILAGSGSTWFVEGLFPGQGRVVTRTDRP
jgi:4-diphosphocytidyl-2-C-methyl-D-erythritol kinase